MQAVVVEQPAYRPRQQVDVGRLKHALKIHAGDATLGARPATGSFDMPAARSFFQGRSLCHWVPLPRHWDPTRQLADSVSRPVLLVGPEVHVRDELGKGGADASLPIELVNATEVVEMHDHPGQAMRRKKDNSIRRCFELVKSGRAGAMVSAGNSGAVMAGAIFVLGRPDGVERPAIISELHCPSRSTSTVALIDTKQCSRPMTRGSLTQSTGSSSTEPLSSRKS